MGACQVGPQLKNSLAQPFLERLSLLTLDLIREPQGASGYALGGAWFVLVVLMPGSDNVVAALFQAGLLETAVEIMRQTEPVEWVSWRTTAGITACAILNIGWTLTTINVPGANLPKLLLDTGLIDVAMSMLKAYELRGVSKVNEGNVCGIWGVVQMLTSNSLDLTSPEARPIVQQLQGIPSALRFLLDHPLSHFRYLGLTSSAAGMQVCALCLLYTSPSPRDS